MATAAEMRNRAVELMTSRTKLNDYTQGSKRAYFFGYPDNEPGNTAQKGYSDCSSAVRSVILEAAGVDIGANTSAQIGNRSSKGMVVHETGGYYPDEGKLLPGDCLYFKGNTSHPLDVGHVEMYIGEGKICGHGSGTGPKIKNMRNYCAGRANSKKRYFMAVRWILTDDAADAVPENGVTIAPGSWNVRTGPGTNYPSAGIVQGGAVLERAALNGWVPVVYGGEVRFIGPNGIRK